MHLRRPPQTTDWEKRVVEAQHAQWRRQRDATATAELKARRGQTTTYNPANNNQNLETHDMNDVTETERAAAFYSRTTSATKGAPAPTERATYTSPNERQTEEAASAFYGSTTPGPNQRSRGVSERHHLGAPREQIDAALASTPADISERFYHGVDLPEERATRDYPTAPQTPLRSTPTFMQNLRGAR
jgi:hypothetical protein